MSNHIPYRWQRLVDSFGLSKPGTNPWDAEELDRQFHGASHGEKCVIKFLLNLWNGSYDWDCGEFDFFDAAATWCESQLSAFRTWLDDPWWP